MTGLLQQMPKAGSLIAQVGPPSCQQCSFWYRPLLSANVTLLAQFQHWVQGIASCI